MSAIDHEHDCPLAHAPPVPTVESVLTARILRGVQRARNSIAELDGLPLAGPDERALRVAMTSLDAVLRRLGAS